MTPQAKEIEQKENTEVPEEILCIGLGILVSETPPTKNQKSTTVRFVNKKRHMQFVERLMAIANKNSIEG